MLEQFKAFITDEEAPVMYITGVAGTGKTTQLRELVEYCISNQHVAVVAAYTHKAVGVLAKKLPSPGTYTNICTLHSYLKKRPTVNTQATKIAHVDSNSQHGIPARAQFLFIDEFSMVGKEDRKSIDEVQYDEEGKLVTKVIYIGDPNQLPPVKDAIAVKPEGKHWVKLTKVHRQAEGNELLDTLSELNNYINGAIAEPIKEHKNLKRNQDIAELYKNDNKDKILLAYTNAKVQELNALIECKTYPLENDLVFSPTLRSKYFIDNYVTFPTEIINIRGDVVDIGNKYNIIDTLTSLDDVNFCTVQTEDGEESVRAFVFGHQEFINVQQELARKAVNMNKLIERQFHADPKAWCKANWSHEIAKKRNKAWKEFMAFKDCVICLDFTHAMTVHKSQGSTYENVYLDIQDIGKCASNDYNLYLKLLYVGISRASGMVYTN